MNSRAKTLSLFLCCVWVLFGQERYIPIHMRAEEQKRQFVKEYIEAELPNSLESFLWRGESLQDTGTVMSILVAYNSWAQEAIVKEIERVASISPKPTEYMTRLGYALVAAPNDLSFEVIRTRFKDHPLYLSFVANIVHRSINEGRWPQYDVIYKALASDERDVRQHAIDFVGLIFTNVREVDEDVWAKALLRRYRRVPTEGELFNDLVTAAIRENDPGQSLVLLPRVRQRTMTLENSKSVAR